MNPIGKKIRKNICRHLFFDSGDHQKMVFLAGTGRSGTTWVEEIINHDNSFRVMFEPFHSAKIPLINDWNYRQYLRNDNCDDKFLGPAKTLLSGKIRHQWIDQYNLKFIARKRLIKDIRANLILKWIKTNFPEIPIIFILRHPCAVANSKIKLKWETHLHDFLIQEQLISDFLAPFKKQIAGARDIFAKHIFMWCIENYVPLKQFSEGEILITFYENLCHEPRKEIERIMTFLGQNFSPELVKIAENPSILCWHGSAIMSGTDPLTSWRKNITPSDIKRALHILQLFGLQKIYGESDMPLVGGENVLKNIF